jgi:geranylgeranyl diphosphate synthase type II
VLSVDLIKEKFLKQLTNTLSPYKERIEQSITTTIQTLDAKNQVRDACEYSLQGGGKRFRPAIVHIVAEALSTPCDVSGPATACEFFHTASLIADDLPCMDNDDVRRGRPTVHKVYGEAVSLLASLALIAAAFEIISKNENKTLSAIASEHAARLNGIRYLIGGQYLDLFPQRLDREMIYEIITKKTVCLFELSFLFGWIFGGGNLEKTPKIQDIAFHFGSAFQILDDIDDMQKDAGAGRKVNFANLFGKKEAFHVVNQHLENFESGLQELQIFSKPLQGLAQSLHIFASSLL